jgi:hypothetical protein
MIGRRDAERDILVIDLASAHLTGADPTRADLAGEVRVVEVRAGVPLQRPDGGPIALPNGGLLGPDPRDME